MCDGAAANFTNFYEHGHIFEIIIIIIIIIPVMCPTVVLLMAAVCVVKDQFACVTDGTLSPYLKFNYCRRD
jgi:uncharacterized membrane protein